ncbi:acyl-CoA-like ligand-binding transcription factor [Qaidamihabitans albus]|uniref:acyl-CoA-like ligand-binding transcription factor n=1 Tax=Qaidamihabitans albus TaxID=2795733 RepID=UPI0018F13315|nr:TetR family transcriptional regulator [Qaidamihabitans albus]
MTTSSDDRPVGLRERKKARTRAAIQNHALRLFMEQGYAATTVEQIAEAAEVSQSTFFRYFPTKEETVLHDRFDPVLIDSFLRQPADVSPIAAFRAALADVFERVNSEESELERARQQLVLTVPELRAMLIDQIVAGIEMLDDAVAERVGRGRGDVNVRAWSGAVIGVVLTTYLAAVAEGADFADLVGYVDRGLALLEDGLPL